MAALLPCGAIDLLVRVAEQVGAEGHEVIDVLMAIDVPDPATLGAVEVHG